MAQGNEDGGGWLRLSLAKSNYKKPNPVSYRMFYGLRTSWKAAGLRGMRSARDPSRTSGYW
jgi:hypothetical protein